MVRKRTIGFGVEFNGVFWKAIEDIRQFPEANHPITNNARRLNLRRFKYGIVYTIRGDHILVAALMHLHRKPNYWQDRLK